MRTRSFAILAGLLAAAALGRPAAAPALAQGPLPTEGYRLVDTWTTRDPVNSLPKFRRAVGLEVASDDTVYVADAVQKQVFHLTSTGGLIEKWDVNAAVGTPLDVAVSLDRVYVVGDQGGEIRSRSGVFQRSFNATGARGIAVSPDRRVFVSKIATVGAGREGQVEVRDVDGNVLGAPWKSDIFPIVTPNGLDVGPDGRVYVAADGAVYVFKDGAVVALLRVRSNIEGPDINDVTVDSRGQIYGMLVGQTTHVVAWRAVVGTQGQYLGDATLSGGRWLSAGPGGGLVASLDTTNFKGVGYIPDRDDLKAQTLTPLRWGEIGETLGQIDAPRRLAVGSQGDAFLVDRLERVQRWNAAGNPQEQWDTQQVADVAGGGAQPCTMRGNSLACLAPAGATAWTQPAPTDGWLTAVSGNANVIGAVDMANQRVVLHNRGSGGSAGGWSFGASTFVAIGDIAMDDQFIFLANRTVHKVERYNLAGQLQSSIDVPGEALRVSTHSGALFALSRNGWVYKYNAAGTLQAAFEAVPGGTATDLAAGPNGRLYVSDFHLVTVGQTKQPVSRVLVYEPGGTPPSDLPPVVDRNCVVRVDKRAAPAQVYVGKDVTVQLTIRGDCPSAAGEVDVALIVDQSGSMSGAAIAAAQAAAVSFLSELDPRGAQVSLVAFSTSASVLSPLTNDLRRVVRSVAQIQSGGTTTYTAGMDAAYGELTGPSARRNVPKVIVMMTDGNPTDRVDVTATVNKLKAAGISMYMIGLGTDLDRDLLISIASSPDQFYEAPTETQLAEVYADIARRIGITRLLKSATVVDELPADMELVPGSESPQPQVNGRTLTWTLADVPITGRALTYVVKPSEPGLRPTNVRATLDYVDATLQPGQATFPVPEVMVLKQTHFTTYLPYLSKNRCRPQRADVVLVFDTSNSMLEPSRPGSAETKLDAAKQAGRAFLSEMTLPGDQASIVSFNGTASTVQRLTGSRAALLSALSGLGTGGGTRIDLGINQAATELLSARHIDANNPVIILLTDGKPSGVTENVVIKAGLGARGLGYQIYAIGLGDADMDLLTLVSGSSKRTFYAPTGDALVGIYSNIAGAALCD